jgi:hypothetical protein
MAHLSTRRIATESQKKAAGGAAKAARWCVDCTPCGLKIVLVLFIVLVLGFSFFDFLSRERER